MFKLVVLCAFLAAASATPGLIAPLTYSSNVVLPAATTYSGYPSSVYPSVYSPAVVSAGPLGYSTPYGLTHLIKKRSVPLAVSSYIAPSTYLGSAPLVSSYAAPYTPYTTTYAGPLATAYSSPLYTTAHLIKKRSAPLIVPSTYIASAPYAAAPFVASPYAAAGHVLSTPYYSTSPVAYTHLIKKRSAILPVATYAAPASYSHQSRLDYQTTSPVISTYSSYSSPVVYPGVGVTHLI